MGNTKNLVGTRIREYEILDIIGQGGMGAVYRARHVYLDEERAIKVINTPHTIAPDSPFINRFIREAKILTKLRHPNLVELYEFGRLEEEMFFMVMELIKGESVLQRMKKLTRIPLNDALRIYREAALGLQLAHQKGIIHRDISPDNLLLVSTESGEEITKVIDFGIAKPTYQETHRYTVGDLFMGKPEFSSPEQCGFHEEGEELDHRSDIYSLAVTLYYMISGKLPFYSATPQGYLVKHASQAPKSISTYFAAGELPDRVERLIMKALSKKRNDRQSSMGEIVEELDAILNPPPPPEAAQARVNASDFAPGYLFARRYEIERKIGKGGMGTVYQAMDKFLDIPVALKTINTDISDDERVLNRLKREVILARKVAHPNVCRIYDIGESENVNYVSMELLDGKSLAEVLVNEGALPIEQGISILKQILDALHAAHTAGVFHRDLKPQNIIVDGQGRAHIMDFGISTSLEVSKLTQTGALIGTPRYMAPEQFGGNQVDHRADIYSIGIIMFEMFTGVLPFEANTPASVMYAHLHSTPPRPSRIVPEIPYELEQMILRALEKDPKNRYQNVSQLLNTLESVKRALSAGSSAPEPALSATVAQEFVPQKRPSFMDQSGATQDISGMEWTRANESAVLPELPIPPDEVAVEKVETSAATRMVQSPIHAQHPPSDEAISADALDNTIPERLPKKPYVWIGAGAGVLVIALIIWFASGSEEPPKVSSAQQQQTQQTTPPVKPPAGTPQQGKPAPSAIQPPAVETNKVVPPPVKPPVQQETTTQTPPLDTPAQGPAVADPAAPISPGTLNYQGPYDVSIYNGKQLVLNSQKTKSTNLPPGQYTLVVIGTSRAIIRDIQKIEIKPGEASAIQIPPMANVTVTATPSNCKVFIDGIFVDIPPIFDLPVQAGNHEIKVVWEKQQKEKVSSFALAAGEKSTVRAVILNDSPDVFQEGK